MKKERDPDSDPEVKVLEKSTKKKEKNVKEI
jgi:hypothetical protein